MSKISIIIPVYNSEKYLRECLDSVLIQTYKNIEIIIVNDGSKDESLKICREYKIKDNRIRIIDKKNEGASIARNIGIESAVGEYILFVDADDWIEPNMCEILVSNIKDSYSDIVFCNHIMEYNYKKRRVSFDLNKRIIDKKDIGYEVILSLIEENDYNLKHERASFRSPWGKLFKLDIINNNKIRFNKDLTIGEDFIFDLEYIKYCKSVFIEDSYLYHYRINDESVSSKYKSDSWEIYKKLLITLQEYLKLSFKEEEYINRLNKLKLKYFMMCIENEKNKKNKKSIIEKRNYIKSICEDEIMNQTLKKYSKGMIGKKNRIKLFLLRNKFYFSIVFIGSVK